MSEKIAVGAIELSSVGIGYQVEDAMLKSASIKLNIARPICPGKYLIVYSGKIADVEAAMATARSLAGPAVVDWLTVASVCLAIFPALEGAIPTPTERIGALGIIETSTAVSAFIAADYAGKAAEVTLYRINVTDSMGGKGLLLITGRLGDVEVAVETGKSALRPGFLTSAAVLPNPEPELLLAYGAAPSKKPEPAPVQAAPRARRKREETPVKQPAPRAKKSDSTGKKDAGEKK
ncbi:MAG: BMC domain-containing protein [Thermoguttaceae bacterium]|nr:BMC domain-containing protein [Thermoguttaceae bacterium]